MAPAFALAALKFPVLNGQVVDDAHIMKVGDIEQVFLARGADHFFQSTGGQWIFVLNEAGTEAVKRPIKIGKQNPQYYEVLEGVKAGESVITSGYEVFGTNERIVMK